MKTNSEWRDWGRRDPLHGVATWPGRDRGGPHPWTDEEFYAVGEVDWEDFSRLWEQYGVDRASCVEIGCGAGRITRQLVGFFGTVQAVDVSSEMIEYARARVPGNVSFAITDGLALPLPGSSVTAAFSSLVFQHFEEVADATRYFSELHRVLAPGGTMMVQLPVYAWPTPFVGYRALYASRQALSNGRALYRRLRLRLGRQAPFFRYLRYDQEWVKATMQELGFSELEFRTIRLRTNEEWLTFVLARRPRQ